MDARPEIISSVAVAIDRDKNSRFALKYALDKCLISRDEVIKLVHVKLRSADSEEAATDPVMSADTPDSFVPFRCFCVCKKMESEMVVLEDYDVAAALVEYVRRCHIQALFLLRGLRDQRKASYVGYRRKRRHSRRMRGKLKSTSFHHPTTTPSRG